MMEPMRMMQNPMMNPMNMPNPMGMPFFVPHFGLGPNDSMNMFNNMLNIFNNNSFNNPTSKLEPFQAQEIELLLLLFSKMNKETEI